MVVGIFLILLGVALLLQNLGIMVAGAEVLVGLAFAGGGVALLTVYVGDRQQWWALIPGFALLGLAAVVGVSKLAPEATGTWMGGLFLGSLALPFIIIYVSRRDHWWALIPAGTMTTLALVAILGDTVGGEGAGGLFFLGLGLTFALLYLVPTPEGRMKWAVFPAGVMFLMAIGILSTTTALLSYVWPLALILGGLYLCGRALFSPTQ